MADVLRFAAKRVKIQKKKREQPEDGRRSPRPPSPPPALNSEREKEIFKVFQTFDLDGNGTISVREMVTCLNAMGKKVTYDEVLQKFHRIDKDGNYEVDYEEFKSMMCS